MGVSRRLTLVALAFTGCKHSSSIAAPDALADITGTYDLRQWAGQSLPTGLIPAIVADTMWLRRSEATADSGTVIEHLWVRLVSGSPAGVSIAEGSYRLGAAVTITLDCARPDAGIRCLVFGQGPEIADPVGEELRVRQSFKDAPRHYTRVAR